MLIFYIHVIWSILHWTINNSDYEFPFEYKVLNILNVFLYALIYLTSLFI